jgi:hypothetical protein
MLSRWPVLLVLPVGPDDVDGDGRLSDAACERLFAAGRAAYFELPRTIDPADVRVVESSLPRKGAPVGGATQVSLSASVGELFPDRFVMAARIRPAEGDAVLADLRCEVTSGEVTAAVRDDLIAIAQSAVHMH